MIRRKFLKTSIAAAAFSLTNSNLRPLAAAAPADDSPKAPGLTKDIAKFVVTAKFEDIPREVIEIGKKSILDGFGLALAGSVAETGPLVEKYLKGLGLASGKA